MSIHWSRRTFLKTTAAAPLIAIETRAAEPFFQSRQRSNLIAAMDEIIPAGDGMPSASEAGGAAYLERVAAEDGILGNEIQNALAALRSHGAQPFYQLDGEARVAALEKFEAEDPIRFAHFRDYVYESYYTSPLVWKLIGYTFYPTDHPGPHMQPFDDTLLADVRKRPKLYREA